MLLRPNSRLRQCGGRVGTGARGGGVRVSPLAAVWPSGEYAVWPSGEYVLFPDPNE